jgi:hypothetical protein
MFLGGPFAGKKAGDQGPVRLLNCPVGSKGETSFKACLLNSLEAVADIMLEKSWGSVGKIERMVVFVKEPVRWGEPPLEEEQRAV